VMPALIRVGYQRQLSGARPQPGSPITATG
jgi:hypothetical protein